MGTNPTVAIRVPGLKVGHAHDTEAATGLTLMLFDAASPASGLLCGQATSTRQADGLRPDHIVNAVDGFLFTGGSAYGLDASGGALRWLEAQGRGMSTRYGLVPSLPGAALYDLALSGKSTRPDADMARAACDSLTSDPFETGSVGAGCGATVGKLFGREQAMKGGLGSAFVEEGAAIVQAIVACNGFGDVYDPACACLIAGARKAPDSHDLLDTERAIREGIVPEGFTKPQADSTVLVAVFTNVKLGKPGCHTLAQAAVDGIRQTLRPALAPFDGDVVFAASLGQVAYPAEPLGAMAASAVARAIVQGVTAADGLGLLPAVRDLGPR